jgi:hypothetical protein
MSKKNKKREPTFERTENRFNADDYNHLLDKAPEIIKDIQEALDWGYTPKRIGSVIRNKWPHKWLQSKMIEAAGRYILSQQD